MSLTKTRLKILQRIAQTTPGAPSSPASPTSPSAPSVPGISTTQVQVPADPSPPASQLYPTLRVGYDANRAIIIDSLVRQLSTATNVATNGKYNLQQLRNNNFQYDPSSFSSPDQKYIVNFFVEVYKNLMNSGQPFQQAVNSQQLSAALSRLSASANLANMAQINPTGQIAQKVPIKGNFKEGVQDLLAQLQPTVQTRRA